MTISDHKIAHRPRILVVGHGTPSSGFGRVTYSLLQCLHHEFEIHHFVINKAEIEEGCLWQQYLNRERFDPWGVTQIPMLVRTLQPALVLFIGERIWHAANMLGLREFRAAGLKVALYCPIEGRCASPETLLTFTELDRLILFTQFAENVVVDAFSKLDRLGDVCLPKFDVIPHGLDLKMFFPLVDASNDRTVARRLLLPQRPELHDGMWILNANRNIPRKHFEITLEAFAKFCEDIPANVRLVILHVNDSDVDQMRWMRHLEAQNRLITGEDFEQPIDDMQLNLIYNCCEVGINSSSSEGWGLIAFEHGATGAAQIVPRHTACQELWQGVGLFANVESTTLAQNGMVYEKVSAQSIAIQLQALYSDAEFLQDKCDVARRLVTEARFHWPRIAAQWSRLLHAMLV